MKYLCFLPICCGLFVLLGSMPGCGNSSSQQEPEIVPVEPAVEKPAGQPEVSETSVAKKVPGAEKLAGKPKAIEVTVRNSEEYEYRTGFGGDEQGASIKVQAGHFEKSEIIRNPGTGFEPVYKYKASGDYVGKDTVELELVDHELGSGPDDPGKTTKTRVIINFTVVK